MASHINCFPFYKVKQECIPVGCVPPVAVAITGEEGLHTILEQTPTGADPLGAGTPLRSRHPPPEQAPPSGAGTPLRSRHPPPEQAPPWSRHPQVWAWRPPGQTPQLPPWVWAWRPPLARPLNFLPGCQCGPGNQ